MGNKDEMLRAIARRLGIGQYRRHVFLCVSGGCCTFREGKAAWEALRKQIRKAGLESGPHACQWSKVECLQTCCDGPTLVVYPDGTWYHRMTADRMPRLVQEHLVANQPVEEWVFAQNPLECQSESNSPGKQRSPQG